MRCITSIIVLTVLISCGNNDNYFLLIDNHKIYLSTEIDDGNIKGIKEGERKNIFYSVIDPFLTAIRNDNIKSLMQYYNNNLGFLYHPYNSRYLLYNGKARVAFLRMIKDLLQRRIFKKTFKEFIISEKTFEIILFRNKKEDDIHKLFILFWFGEYHFDFCFSGQVNAKITSFNMSKHLGNGIFDSYTVKDLNSEKYFLQ